MRPGVATAVECGVTVLMFTSSVCLGIIAGTQLLALNQSEETTPVQLLWARADDVAASNAAAAAVANKCRRISPSPEKAAGNDLRPGSIGNLVFR